MSITDRAEFHVEHSIMRQSFGIALIGRSIDARFMAKPIEFEQMHETHIAGEDPFFAYVDEGTIQTLMDSLWRTGIRPSSKLKEPENRKEQLEQIYWLRGTINHLLESKYNVNNN